MSENLSQSQLAGEVPFHLDYEQYLEPYVDGKVNDIDREIVESHVALCPKCAEELRDLLAFKQQPAVAIRSSRWKRWLPRWSLLSNPAWATAAVIAGFILAMGVLFWTTYRASRRVDRVATGSSEAEKQKEAVEKEQTSSLDHFGTQSSPSNQPTPSREEPLIAFYDAGGKLLVNKRSQLKGFDELPTEMKETVERALATRRLRDSPALKGWTTGAGMLRGGLDDQNTFVPLEPVDVVIETDRPKFRWQALEAARN